MLFLISVFVILEALSRINNPVQINPVPILITASIGLIGNIYVAFKLKDNENLNIKSIFFHVGGDALSSVGVLLSSIIIYLTGSVIVDAGVSIIIAVLIGSSAYYLIRNSLSILLESAPKNMSSDRIVSLIKQNKDVIDVHDLHIWSICSDIQYITAHIVITDKKISVARTIVEDINERLKREMKISHTTFQLEDIICISNTCYTWHSNDNK